MFEENYQNSTVALMFHLFKKIMKKQKVQGKSMSDHTAEIQHLLQCMKNLADLTSDLLNALIILCSLSSEYTHLVQ